MSLQRSELQILQNKAAKIILGRPLYSSATNALPALKWLNLDRHSNNLMEYSLDMILSSSQTH
jgi:hypothetical protein